ncbi:uncharacterized protein BKA78DRAFT_135816 [Phyllosticta capitalensis]|uniref:uncharacterized protein n=1 Tax=Phyllosticta capitalensis TaxID=121624 RepID=UPI00313181D7
MARARPVLASEACNTAFFLYDCSPSHLITLIITSENPAQSHAKLINEDDSSATHCQTIHPFHRPPLPIPSRTDHPKGPEIRHEASKRLPLWSTW